MSLFRDGFGSQNFEDLKAHIKQGNHFLLELSSIVKERARLEESYGHSLAEVSKNLGKKLHHCTGTMASAWGQVVAETKAEADMHVELSATLKADVVKLLDQLKELQKKERKQITHVEETAKKEYHTKLSHEIDKKREAFEATWKAEVESEAGGPERKGTISRKGGWNVAKIPALLGKKKVADDKYFDKWLAQEEGRQAWEAAVAKGCVQLQSLEEKRIDGVKDILNRYVRHLSGKVPRIQRFCDTMNEAAISINPSGDIESFVEDKGIKSPTPEQRMVDCYAEISTNKFDQSKRKDQINHYCQRLNEEKTKEEKSLEGVQKLVDVYKERPQFAEEAAQEDARMRLVGIHQKLNLYQASIHKLQGSLSQDQSQKNPFQRYIGISYERVRDKFDIKNSILKISLSEVVGGLGPVASRTAPEGSHSAHGTSATSSGSAHGTSATSGGSVYGTSGTSGAFGSGTRHSSTGGFGNAGSRSGSVYGSSSITTPPASAPVNDYTSQQFHYKETAAYGGGGDDDEFETAYDEYCEAIHSYSAQQADELSLRQGDRILIREQHEDGWWEGELNGRIGIFPSNYVTLSQ